ncbi:hypothetical protein ACWD5V_00055 [Streptomyces sp. NPDC002523]
MYAPEAWDVPFGDGTGRFSEIIRTPGSWRKAPALDTLRSYEGRAVLVVPGTDTVIPPEVTEAAQDALSTGADYMRLELPDADHGLGLWFRDHAEDRRRLTSALLGGPGAQALRRTSGASSAGPSWLAAPVVSGVRDHGGQRGVYGRRGGRHG